MSVATPHPTPWPVLMFVRLTVFPVTLYDGHKSILISTRSVVGGKNSFLGIAYVAIGGLCVVLGALFTVAHLIRPRYGLPPFLRVDFRTDMGHRKLGDHTYLSWNNDAPATGILASGREARPGGA